MTHIITDARFATTWSSPRERLELWTRKLKELQAELEATQAKWDEALRKGTDNPEGLVWLLNRKHEAIAYAQSKIDEAKRQLAYVDANRDRITQLRSKIDSTYLELKQDLQELELDRGKFVNKVGAIDHKILMLKAHMAEFEGLTQSLIESKPDFDVIWKANPHLLTFVKQPLIFNLPEWQCKEVK